MGCLCCCRSSETDEDYKSLEPNDNKQVIEPNDEPSIDSTSTNSAMQQENNAHLINMEGDTPLWNATKTEQLEHELQKEILIRRYTDSKDKTNPPPVLDDILSLNDSMEQNSDIDTGPEKERRKSNLFRYQSKRSWDDEELSEQEAALKEQLSLLAKQQTEPT